MPELKVLILYWKALLRLRTTKEDYVSTAKILSKYAEDHKILQSKQVLLMAAL